MKVESCPKGSLDVVTVDDIPYGEAFRYNDSLTLIRVRRGPRHRMKDKYRNDPSCHRSVLDPITGKLLTVPWDKPVTPLTSKLSVAEPK